MSYVACLYDIQYIYESERHKSQFQNSNVLLKVSSTLKDPNDSPEAEKPRDQHKNDRVFHSAVDFPEPPDT